jgi:hypothetical protein
MKARLNGETSGLRDQNPDDVPLMPASPAYPEPMNAVNCIWVDPDGCRCAIAPKYATEFYWTTLFSEALQLLIGSASLSAAIEICECPALKA